MRAFWRNLLLFTLAWVPAFVGAFVIMGWLRVCPGDDSACRNPIAEGAFFFSIAVLPLAGGAVVHYVLLSAIAARRSPGVQRAWAVALAPAIPGMWVGIGLDPALFTYWPIGVALGLMLLGYAFTMRLRKAAA